MSTVIKLSAWVLKLAGDLTEEGRIARFDLLHTVEGEMPERCHSMNVADGISDIDMIANELMTTAEQDAATRAAGSSQRYVVAAFRGKNQEADVTFPFVLSGRRGAGFGSFGDSDSPNEKGVIGVSLRQMNESHRLIMNMANATAGHLVQENERIRAQRDKLEEDRFKLRLEAEELLDRKEERELEKARELQRAKRADEMIGMLLSLAPLVLSRLLGKDAGKMVEGVALRDMSVGKLLGNLSESEIMGVINSLEGQNRMVFLEAYKSYRDEHMRKDAEKPRELQDAPPVDQKH